MQAETNRYPARAESNLTAIIGLALLTAIWGSNFFFTKVALVGFAPLPLATARLFIGAVVLTLFVWMAREKFPKKPGHWLWLALLGALNFAIPFTLMIIAQVRLPSSAASMFIASIPLFTLLLTRLVLKQRVSQRRWLGFSIGFIGLIWLTGSSAGLHLSPGSDWIPQGLLIAACICFALSSIVVRRMPTMPPLSATAGMLWLGTAMLLPLGGPDLVVQVSNILNTYQSLTDPALVALASLIFLGILPTGIGQTMRTATIQRHGPVFFSIVGYLVPIWATALGILFLGETLTQSVVLAFMTVLTGLALSHDGGFSVGPGRH